MDKKDFIKMVESQFITKEEYMKDFQKLLDNGIITDSDIEKMPSNFLPIYPIAAAIYERETAWFINGGSPETARAARRKTNYYKRFL